MATFESQQNILGEDPAFLRVLEQVSGLAVLDKPALVIGERGSGKELIAERLHYLSGRWEGPLIKLNCAALTQSLLDTELFGHEAGAFTGAERRHRGRFERADGGTLILDEIATASAATQEKILRVLEYGEFERVGGSDILQVDVRVVGITNVDLPALAAEGAFREDLLDRLAFDVVNVPPLRARPADIPLLARAFALEMTRELGRPHFPGFSARAERDLGARSWPGNVRELKNVIERSVHRHASADAPLDHIVFDPFETPWQTAADEAPADSPEEEHPADFRAAVDAFEKRLLEAAMTRSARNRTIAAEILKLSYHQFRRLLSKHEIR
jgi:psp operon transcriptional activator